MSISHFKHHFLVVFSWYSSVFILILKNSFQIIIMLWRTFLSMSFWPCPFVVFAVKIPRDSERCLQFESWIQENISGIYVVNYLRMQMESKSSRSFLVCCKILSDQCFCGRSFMVLYCVLNWPKAGLIVCSFGYGWERSDVVVFRLFHCYLQPAIWFYDWSKSWDSVLIWCIYRGLHVDSWQKQFNLLIT